MYSRVKRFMLSYDVIKTVVLSFTVDIHILHLFTNIDEKRVECIETEIVYEYILDILEWYEENISLITESEHILNKAEHKKVYNLLLSIIEVQNQESDLNNIILETRRMKQLDTTTFAKMLGLSREKYIFYEKNSGQIPAQVLIKISQLLDLSLDKILENCQDRM